MLYVSKKIFFFIRRHKKIHLLIRINEESSNDLHQTLDEDF